MSMLFHNSSFVQKDDNFSSLRQWEWGLPDFTVNAVREMWKSLGKNKDNFHVIESSTVELYKFILPLWEKYLLKNDIQPQGFTFNAYWTAHPYYERYAGLLPVHFYKFKMIEQIAESFISKYRSSDNTPLNISAFTNNTGSKNDVGDLRDFLKRMHLNKNCWFSAGYDCPGAVCKDIFGGKIMKPYEKVDKCMHDAPYKDREFKKLDIEELFSALEDAAR